MGKPVEDVNCYETKEQREILDTLLGNQVISESFFLTGGTALSVFYLHHRVSKDLDLFSTTRMDLRELSVWIKRKWGRDCVAIKEDKEFVSFLLEGVKVDLVVDPLSNIDEKRPRVSLSNNQLMVDTVDNIVSNKLCAMASRTEPKDYVDFFFVMKAIGDGLVFTDIYEKAKSKDAIFDDPPTVAYQIENGISVIKQSPDLLPATRVPLDVDELISFCEDVAGRIYRMAEFGQTNGLQLDPP